MLAGWHRKKTLDQLSPCVFRTLAGANTCFHSCQFFFEVPKTGKTTASLDSPFDFMHAGSYRLFRDSRPG